MKSNNSFSPPSFILQNQTDVNQNNNNNNIEYEIEGNDYYNTEDINKKNKIKKKNYNYIIKMQKAQSFEQPRDYNYTNKQKNTQIPYLLSCKTPVLKNPTQQLATNSRKNGVRFYPFRKKYPTWKAKSSN